MSEDTIYHNNLTQITKAEIEPMILVDHSGSMTWPNVEGGSASRHEVLGEAIGTIITRLAVLDSQAAKESAEAGDDEGGVMTYIFGTKAEKIGDLRPDNYQQAWSKITWDGGTNINPGWQALTSGFDEEFGDLPTQDKPRLMAVIFTDGEANDEAAFEAELAKQGKNTYVIMALLGYGPEHDKALNAYKALSERNDHIRLVTFGGQTDPSVISDGVLSMLGA
jgi:uncharacterized protein YegL